MKRFIAFGVLTVLAAAPAFAQDTPVEKGKVYALTAQNGSGENGTFALKPKGNDTIVEIHLLGAPMGVAQPAHIHMGTCAKLNPAPKYPLHNVEDGISETDVAVPIKTLMAGGFAVNVHKSTDDIKTYVSCGDISS